MPTTEQLSENSHQGFEGIKAALCLAELAAKQNVASGIQPCLRRNGTGSRCSGKERDAESGLDYFGARYYSGPQGRFTTPDAPFADQHPDNPQSWNLYSYTLNNPLRYIDDDGRGVKEGISNWVDKTGFFFMRALFEPHKLALDVAKTALAYTDPGFRNYQSMVMGKAIDDFIQASWDEKVTSATELALDMAASAFVGSVTQKGLTSGFQAEGLGVLQSGNRVFDFFVEASTGKGNFGLGNLTRTEAANLGEGWVGKGAQIVTDKAGKIQAYVSADGSKVFRPSSLKLQSGKIQANFERRFYNERKKRWEVIANGHADIKDP